jgi:hypothetical protein
MKRDDRHSLPYLSLIWRRASGCLCVSEALPSMPVPVHMCLPVSLHRHFVPDIHHCCFLFIVRLISVCIACSYFRPIAAHSVGLYVHRNYFFPPHMFSSYMYGFIFRSFSTSSFCFQTSVLLVLYHLLWFISNLLCPQLQLHEAAET